MPPTLGDNIDLGLLKMHKRPEESERQISLALTGSSALGREAPGSPGRQQPPQPQPGYHRDHAGLALPLPT